MDANVSGNIMRVRDLPDDVWGTKVVLDKITTFRDSKGILTAKGGDCLFDPELFEHISDYTRSQPTGPSVGRIYRKAFNWPALNPESYPEYVAQQGTDPNWYFFLCVKTPDPRPDFDGSVDHVPFRVVFL